MTAGREENAKEAKAKVEALCRWFESQDIPAADGILVMLDTICLIVYAGNKDQPEKTEEVTNMILKVLENQLRSIPNVKQED